MSVFPRFSATESVSTHSPKWRFTGGLMLALIVIARLVLMAYWSWPDLDSPATRNRLLLVWALGLIALALLGRYLLGLYRASKSAAAPRS